MGVAAFACEVTVLDMNDIDVAKHARGLGGRFLPAVAINGRLALCCSGTGIEEPAPRAAGLGRA